MSAQFRASEGNFTGERSRVSEIFKHVPVRTGNFCNQEHPVQRHQGLSLPGVLESAHKCCATA